jgi:hypothetical protein
MVYDAFVAGGTKVKMMTEDQEEILNKLTELAHGDTALVAEALYGEDRTFGQVIDYIQQKEREGKQNRGSGTPVI